jgi:hypothetical protein
LFISMEPCTSLRERSLYSLFFIGLNRYFQAIAES